MKALCPNAFICYDSEALAEERESKIRRDKILAVLTNRF